MKTLALSLIVTIETNISPEVEEDESIHCDTLRQDSMSPSVIFGFVSTSLLSKNKYPHTVTRPLPSSTSQSGAAGVITSVPGDRRAGALATAGAVPRAVEVLEG